MSKSEGSKGLRIRLNLATKTPGFWKKLNNSIRDTMREGVLENGNILDHIQIDRIRNSVVAAVSRVGNLFGRRKNETTDNTDNAELWEQLALRRYSDPPSRAEEEWQQAILEKQYSTPPPSRDKSADPAPVRPPDEPTNPARRAFFTKAIPLAAVGAAVTSGAVSYMIRRSSPEDAQKAALQKSNGLPETTEWEASELTENWVSSFEYIHGGLSNQEVAFFDQNGNIIDAPIKVENLRLGSKVVPALNPDGKLNQDWLNHWRKVLKEKYPTIHFDLTEGKEFPAQYNIIAPLRGRKATETVIDVAFHNASEESDEAEKSNLKIVQEVFAQSSLPAKLQEYIVYGIPSNESMWNPDLKSDVGATGIWQFMETTAEELDLVTTEQVSQSPLKIKTYPYKGKKLPAKFKRQGKTWRDFVVIKEQARNPKNVRRDYRKDITKSTDAARRYFEQIYDEIKADKDYQTVVERFALQEENFLFPAVLNSYHSGKGRMKKMIGWFAENYSLQRVEAAIGNGPYGLDLFTFMSLNYRASGVDARYGTQSKDYYLKAVSMANLFRAKKENPEYHAEVPNAEGYTPPDDPDAFNINKIFPRHPDLTAGALGALAGVAASGAVTGLGKAFDPDRTFGRRDVITGAVAVGATLAGAAAGTYFGRKLQTPEEIEEATAEAIKEATEEFNWGRIDLNNQVGQNLLAYPALFDKKKANKPAKLRRRIQQTVIRPWLESQGAKLPAYANIQAAREAAKHGKLISLDQYENQYYRCRAIGVAPGEDKRKNNPDYLLAHPHIPGMVEEISTRLNQELSGLGFPADKFWVRVVVTSAIRPADYNAKNKKASPTSAHTRAVAIDLSKSRFDIIDTNNSQFYAVSQASDELRVNDKHRVSAHVYAALTRVLKQMEKEDKIIVNLESDHLHIVDKLS